MRKLPVFVLAAATALIAAGAPMTSQAATFQIGGMNRAMTNCSGQYGNMNISGILGQLGINGNGQSCQNGGNSWSCNQGNDCFSNGTCGGQNCYDQGCGDCWEWVDGQECYGQDSCQTGNCGFPGMPVFSFR